MYKSMKETIANEIASVNRIALTTNLWTSSNQTPFMVVVEFVAKWLRRQ
jgi:hypothetical protein